MAQSKFWRPVDFGDDSEEQRKSQEPAKRQRQHRLKVTAKEEELVLECYQSHADSGWDVVLENIKERVSGPLAGNQLQNEKVREYYRNVGSKAALKRIQRIIHLNFHQQEIPCHGQQTETTETNKSQRMSKTIKERATRYSNKSSPEIRKLQKFAHASNLDEGSSSSAVSSDETAQSVSNISDIPSTSGTTAKGARKSKRKRSRGQLAQKASKSHVKMCSKAMDMMDKLSGILKKYESESDSDYSNK